MSVIICAHTQNFSHRGIGMETLVGRDGGMGSRVATTTNCLKGRALIITFPFTSTVFNQQSNNCANLEACS